MSTTAARESGGGTDGPEKPHHHVALLVLGAATVVAFYFFVVPQIAGLGPTLHRLRRGNAWWIAFGVVVEAASLAGEVVLLRGVLAGPGSRIGWKASYEITLAGGAATKLFAAAGSGGIALTVWALRAAGLSEGHVATRMLCYEILNYGFYMAALAIFGFGLWFGLFAGPAPVGLTLIPALFGAGAIAIVLSMLVVEAPVQHFFEERARRSKGRWQTWWRRAAAVPAALRSGLTAAIALVRRRDPALLGVLAAWAFDILALWASFRAFGHSPPAAVLVMGYYVGTLANALPLPGGIGGVEGGMIGAFLAFGVAAPLTVLAVLAYRTISYWLPTIPGAIAYIGLRGTVRDWRAQPADSGDWRAQPAESG